MKDTRSTDTSTSRREPRRAGGACLRGLLVAAALLPLLTVQAASAHYAQNRRSQPRRATQTKSNESAKKDEPTEKKDTAGDLAALREEFVRLTGEVKKRLNDQLPFLQKNVGRAEDKLEKTRALYAAGYVPKRGVEDDERALAEAKAKVAEVEQQMRAADAQVAETLLEVEAEEQAAKLAAKSRAGESRQARGGRAVQIGSYLRYTGAGFWSISNAWKVQQFYAQRFGRQLPVSAFGQTAVHDRLGFDHRNSMDVPLQPGGAEGQALMDFLRANGIPFMAFTAAIPGSATGPHIHVGAPSHRVARPK